MAQSSKLTWRIKALAAAVGLGLAALICLSPWGRGADQFLYDSLFAIRGEQPGPDNIVVVAIDEPSFAALGLQWPWPRAIHADLIDRVLADGATAVALDIVFAEPSDPEQDAALGEAVKGRKQVVLAVDVNVIRDKAFIQEQVVEPWPDLIDKTTGLGSINLPAETDGFIRRLPILPPPRRPLALEAAIRSGSGQSEQRLLGLAEEGGVFGINFIGGARSIKTVSYYQAILPDHLPAGFFKGKLVFVGVSTSSEVQAQARAADHFPTPFSRFSGGYMAGVEIHAQAANSILTDRLISFWPRSSLLWVGLALGLINVFIFFRLRPGSGGAVLALEAAVAGGGVYLLFTQRLIYAPPLDLFLPTALVYLASPFLHYLATWREKSFIRKAFSTYMSPAVVKVLLEKPDLLKLGGHKETLTVLFSDIRGFTTISEKLEPEVLSNALNFYLDKMTEVVFKHNGVLDKFIGDAVMAVFGAPVASGSHAAQACQAALDMLDELAALNPTLEAMGAPPFKIGIGLNTGPMVIGNMGSSLRFDYTVIGDNVNLGSRLEGQTKGYGVGIIVGQGTKDAAEGDYYFRVLDLIRVKGKAEPAAIYQLVGPRQAGQADPPLLALAEEAFRTYLDRDFETALDALDEILRLYPDDGPAQVLHRRCEDLLIDPPGPDWDGVETKTSK